MPVEADKSASAGAPEAEIEVTPEMMRAGVEAIWERIVGCDLGGHFSAERLAASVYRAMHVRRSLAQA
jgi:hypothetical protein